MNNDFINPFRIYNLKFLMSFPYGGPAKPEPLQGNDYVDVHPFVMGCILPLNNRIPGHRRGEGHLDF